MPVRYDYQPNPLVTQQPTASPPNQQQQSNRNQNKENKTGKRSRVMYTEEHIRRLKWEFSQNPYIKRSEREQVADELGLTERQVNTWFQNERRITKAKRIPTVVPLRSLEANNREHRLLRNQRTQNVLQPIVQPNIVDVRTIVEEVAAQPPIQQESTTETIAQQMNVEVEVATEEADQHPFTIYVLNPHEGSAGEMVAQPIVINQIGMENNNTMPMATHQEATYAAPQQSALEYQQNYYIDLQSDYNDPNNTGAIQSQNDYQQFSNDCNSANDWNSTCDFKQPNSQLTPEQEFDEVLNAFLSECNMYSTAVNPIPHDPLSPELSEADIKQMLDFLK